jgi:hypothetical protein
MTEGVRFPSLTLCGPANPGSPASLNAAFGSKEQLFREAVDFYSLLPNTPATFGRCADGPQPGHFRGVRRDHMMPNSLVTFNRFWLTSQNTAGLPDQGSAGHPGAIRLPR